MSEDYCKVPLSNCPWCGHRLNAAGQPSDSSGPNQPQPGDKCVCIKCAQPMVFTANMGVRKLNLDDIARMEADGSWTDLAEMMERIKRFNEWQTSRH